MFTKELEYFFTSHLNVTTLDVDRHLKIYHEDYSTMFKWPRLQHLILQGGEYLALPESEFIQKLTFHHPKAINWSIHKQLKNLKELEFIFDEKLGDIALTANVVEIKELYESNLKFTCNMYHNPLKCQIWKSITSTSLYWSCNSSAPCCQIDSENSIDQQDVIRLQRMQQIQDTLGTPLVLALRTIPLLCLKIDEGLTNSIHWRIYDVFSGLDKSKPSSASIKHHQQYEGKRRLAFTEEIPDWVIGVSSIVRCAELFDQLPSEIWNLIFEFSAAPFYPYLISANAFKMIRSSTTKVIKVVDWDIIQHVFLDR